MLDQLEVELLLRVVAEGRVRVRHVDLEEGRAAEAVSEDALRGKRVHIVVVTSMFAKEASAGSIMALRANLELNDHLSGLASTTEVEGFLTVGALDVIFAPVLVQFHLRDVRNLHAASV